MGESNLFQMALRKSIPDGTGRGSDLLTCWPVSELSGLDVELKGSSHAMQELAAFLEEKTR